MGKDERDMKDEFRITFKVERGEDAEEEESKDERKGKKEASIHDSRGREKRTERETIKYVCLRRNALSPGSSPSWEKGDGGTTAPYHNVSPSRPPLILPSPPIVAIDGEKAGGGQRGKNLQEVRRGLMGKWTYMGLSSPPLPSCYASGHREGYRSEPVQEGGVKTRKEQDYQPICR